MQWAFLTAAILTEVVATLSLRMAAMGRRAWFIAVVAGYTVAFTALALTLNEGMSLGVAYGIWSAVGVALTAIASWLLFDEPLTLLMIGGLALIAGGVLLVEVGAKH